MKKLVLLFFSFTFLFLACEKENNSTQNPSLPIPDLNYDGDNQSAPLLDAGNYEAAVRFTPAQTNKFAGKSLTAVDFFIQEVPPLCILLIYDKGTDDEPGDILFEQDFTTGIGANSWNHYEFPDPIPITGEDLWISILVEHDSSMRSIGCDSGPAVENGDWLWVDAENEWQTLRQHTNQAANINWNIRGFVGN